MIMHTKSMFLVLFCVLNLCAMEKSPSLQERALAVCMKHHFSQLKKCKNVEERTKYLKDKSEQISALYAVQIDGESALVRGFSNICEPITLPYIPHIIDDVGSAMTTINPRSRNLLAVFTFVSRMAPELPDGRSYAFRKFALGSKFVKVSPHGSRYAQMLGDSAGIDIGSIHPAEEVFTLNTITQQSDYVWLTENILATCCEKGITYWDLSGKNKPLLLTAIFSEKAIIRRVNSHCVVIAQPLDDGHVDIEVFCLNTKNEIVKTGSYKKLGTLIKDLKSGRTPLVFFHNKELSAVQITEDGKFSESNGMCTIQPEIAIFPDKTKLAIAEWESERIGKKINVYDITTKNFILCMIIKTPDDIQNIWATEHDIMVACGGKKNDPDSFYALSYSMSPSVQTLLKYVAQKSVHDGKSTIEPA